MSIFIYVISYIHFGAKRVYNKNPSFSYIYIYIYIYIISQNIQFRWERHAGYCWRRRRKDELISKVLTLTQAHGHTGVSWPAKIYRYWLRADTGCGLNDISRDRWLTATNGEKESRESVQSVWLDDYDDDDFEYIYIYIYIYVYIYIYIYIKVGFIKYILK